MTEKQFIEPNKECRVIKNIKTDETAIYYDTEDGLMFLKWLNNLSNKNEELKKDVDKLIHLLENQSIIIQELHSELMRYQLKEPIILTKKDLELMDKAVSYYTHGRCGE